MTDLSSHVGQFTLRSRLYPALLAGLPVSVNIMLIWPASPLTRLAPLGVAVGVPFFLADAVRGAGQSLEERLKSKWGGLPAQRALWLTTTGNPALTARRRQDVERLLGVPLPSAQAERRNPSRATQEYDVAVRALIPRVRGKGRDELLHTENIRYGFRRNALAIKSVAIAVAIAAAVADAVAVVLAYQRVPAGLALAVSLIATAVWALLVDEGRVRQAAETYSDRFYDALGRLQ